MLKYGRIITFSIDKTLFPRGSKWPAFAGLFEIVNPHIFLKPIASSFWKKNALA